VVEVWLNHEIFFCAALVLFLFGAAKAQEIQLSVYPVDHHARVDSPADVRFLLDAPAGKHGFIGVADGHLVTPDGKRFRMWGINLSGWTKGSALLPPHKDSEVFASELARLGIDCVRFQFLDLPFLRTFKTSFVPSRCLHSTPNPCHDRI
jgi:hypothetical protein